MSILWVKFKKNRPTQVSTKECEIVDDFIKSCKKELSQKLGSYDTDQIFLSITEGETPLEPDDPLPVQNTAKTPFYIIVKVEEEKEVLSMAYGKASMSFITEATGIQEDEQVWEDIPIDTTVEPAQEFVELFKKNCLVFEFNAEASRRTLIDLFLREIVSQFPKFQIICEYPMTLVNEAKKRRLNGKCDYTICHRDLRKLPHLVAIEAKSTNKETMLQCIGECASIHYERKVAGMRNLKVYGIHSTGSIWKFVFIDETGSVFVSKEFPLNPENYVKEGVDLIYRLVYYVVKQSHINSPRTTPVASSVSVNEQ